ncbi:MAG: aminotransferase class I/II-fold pyridoxal phosphate-dependent enzyme [Campylobacterales bacterium]|nr:aminotransferase class I/II-fold pyridoxal phosphate-dependent enzyme [Campylobacterales bacterium]
MKRFKHGGDVESFAKKQGIKKREVIDLSSNINFITPKFKIKPDLKNYPKYDNLKKAISKRYKIKKKQFEIFNGGSSAIFSFFRSLETKDFTIYSPAYLEYKKAGEIFGFNIHHINRLEDVYKKPKKGSLVIFVNPSTPDGKLYDLKKLLKIWKERGCIVFIDESFLDFTKGKSAIKQLKDYKKLYILKSLTKFYSSAGTRVGIVVSNRENIERIKYKEPLWKISNFDSLYFAQVLNQKKFIKKTIKITKKNRKILQKILSESSFVKEQHPTSANFVLAKIKNISMKKLQKKLAKKNIMARDCSNFDFLGKNHIRFAVKSKQEIKVLKRVL